MAHHSAVDCFVDLARRMGKDVKLVAENEIDGYLGSIDAC